MSLISQLLANAALTKLAALVVAIIWMLRNEKDKIRSFLVIGLALNLVYEYLQSIVLGQANGLLHWKYDYYLFRMDGALGVSTATVASLFSAKWTRVLGAIYGYTVPMAVLWIWVSRKHADALVRGYIAELGVGPLLYAVLPACGPVYAFGSAWMHPPTVQPVVTRISAFPNAFPSLHLATALLFVLTAEGKFWRGVSLVFFAGTALATLTTGEHYVIDLVAGLAFGCFLAKIGNLRWGRAGAYLGLTLAWSLAIRFGIQLLIAHPSSLRICSVLTVAIAVNAIRAEWRDVPPAMEPIQPNSAVFAETAGLQGGRGLSS
jgi:hypothetical protein